MKTSTRCIRSIINCISIDRTGYAKIFIVITLLISGLYSISGVQAQEVVESQPFDNCPTQAFLTQGKQAKTYSVNLITGEYNIAAQTHGTNDKLNAMGFNPNDRYIYGWSYKHNQPARLNKNWTVEPLSGVNITDKNFYVGDVSPIDNKYYVYRRGEGYGLYSIGLNPEEDDYLRMIKVADGANIFLRIFDLAFHPRDGFAYAVDSRGNLFKISTVDGSYDNLGFIGQKGVFGASYFDTDGNLYIGRNNDGKIYRIAIDTGVYESELFTIGPASSTNDGSRCAIAPLNDNIDTRIDFGDAPDSYGTSLMSNGARHGIPTESLLYLGTSVDGESDASAYPLSDDHNSDQNDEDGIQFVTNIVENEKAIILVSASAQGYLNAWIDYNRNGEFDQSEQVITDKIAEVGQHAHYIDVPAGVSEGSSWARFRISSTPGLQAIGGTPDGEVEDYQVDVQKQNVIVASYPSANGWTTVAFEDNWPFMGDYDMNDLVVYLRNSVYSNEQGALKLLIEGELAAAGASYHNGFAMRLPGVLRSQINDENLEFRINGQLVSDSPLEVGRSEAIFIVAEDVHEFVDAGEDCTYYRTEIGCGSDIDFTFSIMIPFNELVQADLSGVLDPFIFASDSYWHGDHFSTPPGRSYEVHLKNIPPTEAFNSHLFKSVGQDASVPSNGIYFQTNTGLPWAIEVGDRWNYPSENNEIMKAYPEFKMYAESMGRLNTNWYAKERANPAYIFTE